jgi:lysozyme
MKISKRGLNLIKRFEGLSLDVYRDSVGVLTIGYGHTRTADILTRISAEQADALLIADLADAEAAVLKSVRVALEQHEFDALVCLAFNIGAEAFRKSTLVRLVNQKADNAQIGAEFMRWVFARGKKLVGLERRRAAERQLFMGLAA